MKNLFKLTFATLLLTFLAFGCQKQIEPDQATGNDVRVADLAVSDVFTYSAGETDNNKSLLVDSVPFSKEIDKNDDGTITTTLTFNSEFPFNDGIIRSGQIIITWQYGWRVDSNKQATVNFNEFSRDGNILSGNLKFQIISDTPSITQPPIYKIVEDNMELTLATGEKTTWDGTRTIEWLNGFLTPHDRSDDVRKVNFTKEGVNRNGEAYTATGVDLIFDSQCGKGKVKFTSGTITTVKKDVTTIFDFGDGECDDTFTITQNGITLTLNQ